MKRGTEPRRKSPQLLAGAPHNRGNEPNCPQPTVAPSLEMPSPGAGICQGRQNACAGGHLNAIDYDHLSRKRYDWIPACAGKTLSDSRACEDPAASMEQPPQTSLRRPPKRSPRNPTLRRPPNRPPLHNYPTIGIWYTRRTPATKKAAEAAGFVNGGGGRIRTFEGFADRFTVCSL